MKTLGFIMLHYGAEYLEYALHPLCEVCDKVIILYSKVPTHNSGNLPLTESRDELMQIACKFDKVHWIDVFDCINESDHISRIFNYTEGYDVLVRADADEVWDIEDLKAAIHQVYNTPYMRFGVDGFIHFWRSFNYRASHNIHGVECDYFRPVRLWHLREKNTAQEPSISAKIYHFGYAISEKTMRYKLSCHGHKSEFREGWLNSWISWQPEDNEGYFHPTTKDIWHRIAQFDSAKLPEKLHFHPYFNQEII
jgi:hypothetical protein